MKEVKSQSRGEIVLIGKECKDWVEIGDVVSFYRNATTTVKGADDEEYLLVHEDHVLLKY
jgi:co-chaperonin GroES (HSP10)